MHNSNPVRDFKKICTYGARLFRMIMNDVSVNEEINEEVFLTMDMFDKILLDFYGSADAESLYSKFDGILRDAFNQLRQLRQPQEFGHLENAQFVTEQTLKFENYVRHFKNSITDDQVFNARLNVIFERLDSLYRELDMFVG